MCVFTPLSISSVPCRHVPASRRVLRLAFTVLTSPHEMISMILWTVTYYLAGFVVVVVFASSLASTCFWWDLHRSFILGKEFGSWVSP